MVNMMIGDCMELMARTPDKFYDLAIVDPPYGIGESSDRIRDYNNTSCKSWKNRTAKEYLKKDWDNKTPNQEYFDELFRVSKNQIIWGCNYFTDKLPVCGGRIIWDKQVVMPTFSDGEIAFNSLNNSVNFGRFLWAGYRKCEKTDRIHPTQKPTALYKWLLKNYAKPNDKILDTHGGSGSICIACHDMGFDLDWVELDKDYFEAAKKRFENHIQQQELFEIRGGKLNDA